MTDCLSCAIRELHDLNLLVGTFIYVVSNEIISPSVRNVLAKTQKLENACHLGFSGWYNFDIAVVRQSARIIICDINPNQISFLKRTLIMMIESTTREQFVETILVYIKQEIQKRIESKLAVKHHKFHAEFKTFDVNLLYLDSGKADITDVVPNELTRPYSWLSSNHSYNYIRNLAMNDRIAVLATDIANINVFSRIRDILDGYQIDTLYISNIPSCLSQKFVLFDILKILQPKIVIWADDDLIQKIIVN